MHMDEQDEKKLKEESTRRVLGKRESGRSGGGVKSTDSLNLFTPSHRRCGLISLPIHECNDDETNDTGIQVHS